MKLNNLDINGRLIFAPIAGYSDLGARCLATKYGAAFCYTEMVSAKGLYYKNENTKTLLATDTEERIRAVQLFGNDPDILAEAVASEELKPFDIIDLNCGCPVPKVYKNGEGSALMDKPDTVYKILKAMTAADKTKAITCKIRLGIKDFSALEVAKAVEESGAAMLTVHGRTREQMFSGEVDYEKIALVKEAVRIPVVGNGNVFDKESLKRMEETGVDGVMIARGALGRPYIFAELQNKEYSYSVKDAILFHIEKLRGVLPDKVVANNMKLQIAFYLKGSQGYKTLRHEALQAKDLATIFDIVNKIV